MQIFFDKIIGNESIRSRIGKSISDGTLPHALMITGPDGSGKLLFAREIAAAVNCTQKNDASTLPCGVCNNCRRIRGEQFLDLHIFRKDENHASVKIDPVRAFLHDITMSGAESDYRFYIFEDAELMTTQTQNSLLKILEEPPVGVYIILLCEHPDSMLTTIKSRVQTLSMARFTVDELDRYLCSNSADAKMLKLLDPDGYFGVLAESEGCIGQALALMNKSSLEKAKERLAFTKGIIRSLSPRLKYTEIRAAITTLPKKRQELESELDRIIKGISELVLLNYDKNKSRVLFRDEEEATALMREIGVKRLIKIYDMICRMKDDLLKNANASMLITRLSIELCS